MILRELTPADEMAFYNMLDRWEGAPGFSIAFGLLDDLAFTSYLSFLRESRNDFKPSTTYFAFVEEEIVGKVNIRHSLTDEEFSIGHIGFGVMPLHRGKGFGHEILRLALIHCRTIGMSQVLLACESSNIASQKVIQKNGGFLGPQDTSLKNLRYWISL
jgi:predicted acetyltransferase